MARVVLLGDPSLPGFARHRLQLFTRALSGHTLCVLDVRDARLEREFRSFNAEIVVTAGSYAPTRAALALVGEQPLWVDLPGDPFADAQAYGGGDPLVAADAAAVFVPALARGDAFSTISERSRWALLGQLGLLGRVARCPPEQALAEVIPVAWDFGVPPTEQPRVARPRPLRVLLAGSFNTWFDDETLLAGLLLAMQEAPVEVCVLGGPVPGHAETGWRRFCEGARQSSYHHAFSFHPWVPDEEISALTQRCHVGVSLDRPGLEPELGSRTRLLFYLHQGLSLVATTRSELAASLADAGVLHAVAPGSPEALASALLGPLPVPDRSSVAEQYSPARVVLPLQRWAAAPRRAPPSPNADLLQAALIERDRLQAELGAIRSAPLFRFLSGAHAGLRRLRAGRSD